MALTFIMVNVLHRTCQDLAVGATMGLQKSWEFVGLLSLIPTPRVYALVVRTFTQFRSPMPRKSGSLTTLWQPVKVASMDPRLAAGVTPGRSTSQAVSAILMFLTLTTSTSMGFKP